MVKNLIFGVYLQFQIFCQKVSKSTNTSKKVNLFYYLTIHFRSKNLTHSTNVNSLNIIKNTLPQYSQKHVSGWCQKKHLHCTISRRPRTVLSELLDSKCLYIPLNLYSNVFIPETQEAFILWVGREEAEQFPSGRSLFGTRKMF